MTSSLLIQAATQVRLLSPAGLRAGDVIRMASDRAPFEVGLFLGNEEDGVTPLIGALDGPHAFKYWRHQEDTSVRRLIAADDVMLRVDTAEAETNWSRTLGSVVIDENGAMLCLEMASNGPRQTQLYSFSGAGFSPSRLEHEHFLAYPKWALGFRKPDGEFVEVVKPPVSPK